MVCTESHKIQHFRVDLTLVKMDTPLAATVHKENVHIGGGKATVTMKQDKLKTVKKAGKRRKALADLRSAYGLVAAASKDIDLKQKSDMRGNKIKKNPRMQGKQYAVETITKKLLGIRLSKGANLKSKPVLLDNYRRGNTPCSHTLTDEVTKQCCEWAEDGMEDMDDYAWSTKHEDNLLMNETLSEIMASATGVPIEELEKLIPDEEGYETDESYLNNFVSVPGPVLSLGTLEDLDDYPLPEFKLNDEYEEFSTDNVAEIDGINS